MAYNNRPNRDSAQDSSYHLISPNAIKSDISTGRLQSVAPPSAPRSRYWTRTVVLLLVPLSVTGYYYWIWQYLLSRTNDNAIKYGSATEIWVYYSWFIIGVFALEWSKHGLVGVEVAMLETKTFGVPHLVALLSHSEGTWSGPGGWFKSLTKVFKRSESGVKVSLGVSLRTYKLWYLLAFISLSLYVGMPLSGLTMELSDGYVWLGDAPMVVGRNSTTFHKRYKLSDESDNSNAAQTAWGMGSPATLPGIGIIFTPKDFNREDHKALAESPNLLPNSQGIPEMFIVPQALGPISGRAWGLRIGYDCSVVEDVSSFTVLGHHTGGPCGAFRSNSSQSCATAQMFDRTTNVWSYSEVGTRLNVEEPESSHDTIGNEQDPLISIVTRANILEWAVWQVRTEAAYAEVEHFNNTVGRIVQGIGSPFIKASNNSWITDPKFFEQKRYATFDNTTQDVRNRLSWKSVIDVAAAVGVRCVVRSALGSAEVDARTSSFTGFKAEDATSYTDPAVNAEAPMPQVGSIVESVVSGASLEDIFTSINVRAMSTESNSVQVSGFVSSNELQKSAYLAWGHEVLHIMYDNYYGFETSWPYNNLTSSRKGKVLTKGEVPPLVTVIPFGIWAFGSFILGIFFGFRRRLADSLNGFSFFRFGVYSADKLNKEGLMTAKEAEDVAVLWNLPGTLERSR